LTSNFFCGSTPSNNSKTVHSIYCPKLILGRYISAQKKADGVWDIVEVDVIFL
jgi:hypothetical protein